jgi:hypothetical protein
MTTFSLLEEGEERRWRKVERRVRYLGGAIRCFSHAHAAPQDVKEDRE